jgi:hypothetical protein
MSYGSGRFPLERASKLGHIKLVEHEQVARLIRQFERIDPVGDVPIGQCTGNLDLADSSPIRFVLTVDGGQAVIPNEIRRDKRVAFINVCAMLIERAEIQFLREHPVVDPRDVAKLFDGKVWYHPAALPLAGVSIPGETVRETIRKTVDAVLEYTQLYSVLDYLVSRKWDPKFDMSPNNPEAPHMDCLACGAVIWLPKQSYNFSCGACGYLHRLSDYLGIGADGPEDWAREEAAMSLRNVLETSSRDTGIRTAIPSLKSSSSKTVRCSLELSCRVWSNPSGSLFGSCRTKVQSLIWSASRKTGN